MVENNNKIIIAGGTGFLGNLLIKEFIQTGAEIIVLTRSAKKSTSQVRYISWDGINQGDWVKELDFSKVVINLTGKSVNCRYTKTNQEEIISSRVNSTLAIGKAINSCFSPPELWINAGSAAIFGNSGEEVMVEDSNTGEGFSPHVCKLWEKAFSDSKTPRTRKVFLRIGLVLQKNEGLLKPFLNLVKFGFGGKIGSGEQYISWIHEKDFVNIIKWIINKIEIEGNVHCCSPVPVKNREFMNTMRKARGVLFGLPNPAFLVHFGALFIGTEGNLVLEGRRVISKVLKDKDYRYEFPKLDMAMKDLVQSSK